MKKILTITASLLLTTFLWAQQPHPAHQGKAFRKEPPKIEEVIDDLSAAQKKKLAEAREEHKAVIDKYNAELKQVRDSIHVLMRKDGDQSAVLFPLVDKQNSIEAAVTKEMYKLRVKIDQILTKEQIDVFKKKMAEKRKHHHKDKKDKK